MFCFILFFGKRGLHFALSVGGSHQEATNYLTAVFGDVLVAEGEGEWLDKTKITTCKSNKYSVNYYKQRQYYFSIPQPHPT